MRLFKKNIIQNRKVNKARFLYLYVIFGSVMSFVYFVVSVFRGWPKFLALSPIYLLALFFVGNFFIRNWKYIWFYIVNVERGKLLLFLNKTTHWEEHFKIKVANWVYPGNRSIRKESHDIITKKVMDGIELTPEEKIRFKYNLVFCPQQIKLGFNEALLVNALIYSHKNIQPLDKDMRSIMDLTEDHILKFNLMTEAKKAGYNEHEKMIEIGKRRSNELNKAKK